MTIFQPVALSDEAMCIKARYCCPSAKAKTFPGWVKRHFLIVADVSGITRALTPVSFYGRHLWMDAITGSLFKQNGGCLTSENLQINQFLFVKYPNESRRWAIKLLKQAQRIAAEDD